MLQWTDSESIHTVLHHLTNRHKVDLCELREWGVKASECNCWALSELAGHQQYLASMDLYSIYSIMVEGIFSNQLTVLKTRMALNDAILSGLDHLMDYGLWWQLDGFCVLAREQMIRTLSLRTPANLRPSNIPGSWLWAFVRLSRLWSISLVFGVEKAILCVSWKKYLRFRGRSLVTSFGIELFFTGRGDSGVLDSRIRQFATILDV